ncbi:MAG: FAD-binding oxidoreductase [Ferruginibacter sp.]
MKSIVKILSIAQVTHDVRCFQIQKPAGFSYVPGQATDVSINKPGIEEETRPFTFTSLNQQPYLEFTIKRYEDHHGITDKIHQLQIGDEMIIREAWGAIEYKGPGYFIAGGAGITPFVAILRALHLENKIAGNKLFFSNKKAIDVIYEKELKELMGDQVVFILSKEDKEGYRSGHINDEFIQKNITDFNKHFYICGPDKMVADISYTLSKSGADIDSVIFEK